MPGLQCPALPLPVPPVPPRCPPRTARAVASSSPSPHPSFPCHKPVPPPHLLSPSLSTLPQRPVHLVLRLHTCSRHPALGSENETFCETKQSIPLHDTRPLPPTRRHRHPLPLCLGKGGRNLLSPTSILHPRDSFLCIANRRAHSAIQLPPSPVPRLRRRHPPAPSHAVYIPHVSSASVRSRQRRASPVDCRLPSRDYTGLFLLLPPCQAGDNRRRCPRRCRPRLLLLCCTH